MTDYTTIAKAASDAAHNLHQNARGPALKLNCRIYSRGFEFLSLDSNGERDENLVDYCDRDEMTPAMVEQMADKCRKAGSCYLGIGYGVDAAESRSYYEAGDYEPMFDWVDLPNVDLRQIPETMSTIDRIKAALDAGLRVTLADNPNYEVIKDEIGQYLIAYCHGSMDANYIGLHGMAGTEYETKINMRGDWIVSGRITG